MSVILVTGASGFVGSRLVKELAVGNTVVALSRSPVAGEVIAVTGDFTAPESLARLDDYPIDAVVHLAGVTGAAAEEEAITVNVAGTRRLLRYLIDRGTRRFVLASSIAAAGCLDPDFRPRSLPIPDDHPCDSTNIYGVSKAMVEDLAAYFHRLDASLDITLFRLGVVAPEDTPPVTRDAVERMSQPFCDLGVIAVQDAAEALALAATTDLGPGCRTLNLVAPMPRTPLGTAETLRLLLGDRAEQLDLSYYRRPGNEHAGVYAIAELARTFGYTPPTDVRSMKRT
ncbi:NAD(P)-dependent oxidoreductase [Kribbella sp.]|uniref:NAD-dependent epimerase/dehydratase family protein n=1 Tax=Kribbella sp. TaxID=1871183 RepID=UPI002D249D70|nr:NAD(P)-dependent oxidoreductase [Kribbella sp.]HZX02866.1 NAD(P)-dependent oxidoreductase [Kribbella sp.]